MPITQKPLTTNKYGIPDHSALANTQTYNSGVDFEMQNEVQQRFVRSSSVNLRNVIQPSNTVTNTFVLAPGSAATFGFVTFFNSPHYLDPVLGAEYISLYQQTGTVTMLGTAQFYPTFGNTTGVGVKDYYVQFAYNWHRFDGIHEFVAGFVRNDTAGTQTVQVVSQAFWINYNSGTA